MYGATGFTGRLVAEYLAQRYGAVRTFKWALAGRSVSALQGVRDGLVKIDTEAAKLPIIVADCNDDAAVRDMVSQTRVVLSTVGPYSTYGELIVKHCAQLGVHYCDITGEASFVYDVSQKYGEIAVNSGAKLVNAW